MLYHERLGWVTARGICVYLPCQNAKKMMDLTVRNLRTGSYERRSSRVAW